MKMRFASLLLLTSLAGPALAETPAQSAFLPVPDALVKPEEGVQRAASRSAATRRVDLAPTQVAEVDTNGDGEISFEELLLHDFSFDF